MLELAFLNNIQIPFMHEQQYNGSEYVMERRAP